MQKHVNLVDLVKSFPTNIVLQNLASIQKRTSPIKFAHLAEKSGKGSTSNLSTKVGTEDAHVFLRAHDELALGPVQVERGLLKLELTLEHVAEEFLIRDDNVLVLVFHFDVLIAFGAREYLCCI